MLEAITNNTKRYKNMTIEQLLGNLQNLANTQSEVKPSAKTKIKADKRPTR
jgi:transketolase